MLLTLGSGCKHWQNSEPRATARLLFERQHATIRVEIAASERARSQGLMHRKALAADRGMLFVFADEAVRGVWMKNTHIPLDVLFLSARGEIVSSLRHLSPCLSGTCEVYYSDVPARYMLEVNAGFIDHWEIEPGDMVSWVGQR